MDFRKTIKVLSILALIGGILGVIAGAFALIGGGAATAVSTNQEIMNELNNDEEVAAAMAELNASAGTDLDAQTTTMGVGVIAIVAGIFSIILGIIEIIQGKAGLNAAKGLGAGKAFTVGIVVLVLNVISAIINVANGSGIIGSIIGVALTALYVYCAKSIKEEEAADGSAM